MLARDSFVAVVIFVFSAAFFYMAGDYEGGAEVFPRGVSAVMMIASTILFFRGMRGPAGGERLEPGSAFRIAGVIILTILYIVAVDSLGFVTSSLVFVPATAYFLGIRNHLLIWLATILFVVTVAYLFRNVFQVPLPRELVLTLL